MRHATKLLCLAALLAGVAGAAGALEISLEENKAARGNIGYIDVKRIYQLYPGTQKAKESFREIVRQAEEQVNLKRAELIALRRDITQLKLERETLEKSAPPPATPEDVFFSSGTVTPPPVAEKTPQHEPVLPSTAAAQPAAAPLPPTATAHARLDSLPQPTTPPAAAEAQTKAQADAQIETENLARQALGLPAGKTAPPPVPAPPTQEPQTDSELQGLPGMSRPLTSELEDKKPAPSDADEPLIINIPGVTDKPIIVSAPEGGLIEKPAAPEAPLVAASTAAAAAASAQAEAPTAPAAPMPQMPPVPQAPLPKHRHAEIPSPLPPVMSRSIELQRLDLALKRKEGELAQKEQEFAGYQRRVEKNLLDIESKRSEILLGKIYQAVRVVARENGVSVVVDKNQILFGQDSVDLTLKVVRKLEETP